MINIINQFFEIERKASDNEISIFQRNLERLQHEFELLGYRVINPKGQVYDPRDTSVEASIINEGSDKLMITKVLKPIIYKELAGNFQLVQKGIVIVE